MFGAPLHEALKHSSVAISLVNQDGKQYVWGYVPVIVAKIGLFLKQNGTCPFFNAATEIEGVFRINGSEKRMKELRQQFDTPPQYGKDIDWAGYNVHDAASLLRRFLNLMPEPIIPFDRFDEFREVLARPDVNVEAAIGAYRSLITSCPPATQYLLLYILDLLAVFERTSDVNRMNAGNLAIIFQPGMLSHPTVRSKEEHQFAVRVVEFLITHQDHFVLALSAPPPEDMRPEELAKPSERPLAEEYYLVPSDSDEDLGEMKAHMGGGAMLGRTPTQRSKAKWGRREEKSSLSHDKDATSPAAKERKSSARAKSKPIADARREGRKRANSHSDANEQMTAPDAGPSSAPRARIPSRSPVKRRDHLAPPTAPMRPPLGKRSASATSCIETVQKSPSSRTAPLPVRAANTPPARSSAMSPSSAMLSSSPQSSLQTQDVSVESTQSTQEPESFLESKAPPPQGDAPPPAAPSADLTPRAAPEEERPPTPPEKEAKPLLREKDAPLLPAPALPLDSLPRARAFTTDAPAPPSVRPTEPRSTTLPSPYAIDPRLAQLGPVASSSANGSSAEAVGGVPPHRAAAPIPYATTMVAPITTPVPILASRETLLRHAKVMHTISGRQ